MIKALIQKIKRVLGYVLPSADVYAPTPVMTATTHPVPPYVEPKHVPDDVDLLLAKITPNPVLTLESPEVRKYQRDMIDYFQRHAHQGEVLAGETTSHEPAKGKRPRAFDSSVPKLTIEQVNEIRKALETPYRGIGKDLAKQYGVNQPTISRIRRGVIYRQAKEWEVV